MNSINNLSSKNIPKKLQQLAQPPKQLFVKGDLGVIANRPCLAVVGSRKVSRYGREVTEKLTTQLARHGIVIISGLALGVDSIAHRACLDAGGKTIAVLPTPLERVYPAGHRKLAQQIVGSGGALVSEYSAEDSVFRMNFVARNRLVAALADAVLITEAALKSGSLHTARYALELGRDVLAVPGNITSPTSQGCNNLIKRGATPVTGADDILFALGISPEKKTHHKTKVADPSQQLILDLMTDDIDDGAVLLEKSKLSAPDFNQAMTMLEIGGQIRSLGANHWSLT